MKKGLYYALFVFLFGATTLASDWEYSETADKMRGETTYLASLTSSNSVPFKFPFDGGSKLAIVLKQKKNDFSIQLRISKGQFQSADVGATGIQAKFDDGKIATYIVDPPADNSTDIFFVREFDGYSKRFYSNLQKSKKLIVEVGFYQEGKRQFEFEIPKLDPKKFKKKK